MARLRQAAEALLAAMMAVMFAAFIAQVVFRYGLNLPLAWSDEVCTIVWMWGILWGASFVMTNREDVRFDMLYNLLPRSGRRWATALSSAAFVVIMVASLPASWKYISFMKVEYSAAFRIRMDLLFSIYLVFVVAVCIRHADIVWDALRDRLVEDDDGAAGTVL